MFEQFKPSPRFLEHLPQARDGEWMPCPRCGSARTRFRSFMLIVVGSAALGAFVIWTWYTPIAELGFSNIIGLALGIAMIVAGPAYLIHKRSKGIYVCSECRLSWTWRDIVECHFDNPSRQMGGGE